VLLKYKSTGVGANLLMVSLPALMLKNFIEPSASKTASVSPFIPKT